MSAKRAWPSPVEASAFQGIAGDFVRLVEPHTEADPIALLTQFIVAFGSIIGRGPHVMVGADRHGANLAMVLVGQTSRGRKGTSEGWVRALFRLIDPRWVDHQVRTGLTSGEGLIHAVRDPTYKVGKDGQQELADLGEADKRLTAVEPEFARVLRAAGRESNTLSAQIRLAWDAPAVMRTMTRSAPLAATGAHVSLIGHITAEELTRELNTTDTANGFANRFLWVAARRSKSLPEGGELRPRDLAPLAERLGRVVEWATSRGELERDGGFRDLWRQTYEHLTAERRGLLGAVTSRAEAQTLRLSAIFALLDSSEVIGRRHLEGALAVWDYCDDSAAWVFGEALGDPLADQTLAAIRERGEAGLTRTEIRDHFGRNKQGAAVDEALDLLEELGLVSVAIEPTGGRPRERWRARPKRPIRPKAADRTASVVLDVSVVGGNGHVRAAGFEGLLDDGSLVLGIEGGADGRAQRMGPELRRHDPDDPEGRPIGGAA